VAKHRGLRDADRIGDELRADCFRAMRRDELEDGLDYLLFA
jgi:hypothetical protein